MLLRTIKLGILLGAVLGIAYFLQINFFTESYSESKKEFIKVAYLYNFAFSSVLFLNFILFRKKLIEIIGFIFLGAGVLKIGVFYFLVNRSDFEMNKSTFLLFFIPYIISLAGEVFYLVEELKRVNFNNDN